MQPFVHKAQGSTVDNTYVPATPHFDRHTAYVALSRHRDNATVFYATDDFGGRAYDATEDSIRTRFTETLSRARPKELAHDYLELETGSSGDKISGLGPEQKHQPRNEETHTPSPYDLEWRRQAAAECWATRQQHTPAPGQGASQSHTHARDLGHFHKDHEHRLEGPEEGLEM